MKIAKIQSLLYQRCDTTMHLVIDSFNFLIFRKCTVFERSRLKFLYLISVSLWTRIRVPKVALWGHYRHSQLQLQDPGRNWPWLFSLSCLVLSAHFLKRGVYIYIYIYIWLWVASSANSAQSAISRELNTNWNDRLSQTNVSIMYKTMTNIIIIIYYILAGNLIYIAQLF